MDVLNQLVRIIIFPGGLFLIALGLFFTWLNRKLIARFQNRMGPRWFQPLADVIKLLVKEEIVPNEVNPTLFQALPVIALTGALTSALYVPIVGLAPSHSFDGDLIVAIYLLSLLTLSTGFAGSLSKDRFSLVGATRVLTQQFSYEAPFMLALLGPAIVSGSWSIAEISAYAEANPWFMFLQPVGFIVAIIGLMGKLELRPFDAPEAETEIVAGALTEYSGRGLAMFKMGQAVELVIGLTLISALYLGGIANPFIFILKTIVVLLVVVLIEALSTRLRIDQTVGIWWRYGSILVLLQFIVLIVIERVVG